jgi:PAS domain S-box-containing protein/putative nucleotidyltransferase with HDIG domain
LNAQPSTFISNKLSLPVIKGVAYIIISDTGKVFYSSPQNEKLFNIHDGDQVHWIRESNKDSGCLFFNNSNSNNYSQISVSTYFDLIWHGVQANMLLVDAKESRNLAQNKIDAATPAQQNSANALPWTTFKCHFDKNLEVFSIDENSVALTGFSVEELVSEKGNYRALISDIDRETIFQIIQKSLAAKEPYHLLYQILTKQNEYKWIEEQGQLIEETSSAGSNLEGWLKDVTDRKKIEDALWESESRYRSLVEASPDAVLLLDKTGKIILCNKLFCDFVNVESPEKLQNESIFQFIHMDEPLAPDFNFQTYLSLVPPKGITFTLNGADNSLIPLETSFSFIRGSNGEISACVAIGRDVRQRKQSEQALRESEARYRAIVENNPEMIVRLNSEGVVTFANTAFSNFTGLPSDKIINQKLLNQAIPHGNHIIRELLGVLSPNMEPLENEFSIHKKNNEDHWYRWRTFAIKDETGNFLEYQCIGEEITDQKKAQQAKKESETRMAELMENIKLLSIVLDLQGRIISINSYFTELTGWSKEEALNQDWFGRFIPANIEISLRDTLLENAQKDVLPIRNENPILTKSGEQRLISWTNTLMKDPLGKPAAIASIGEDITEKDQMERIQNTILKISQTTTESSNLDHIFLAIHEILKKLVPVDNFFIALYDSSKNVINFPYFVDQFDPCPAPKKPGKGLTEYVLRYGKPVTINPEKFRELVAKNEVESIGAPSLDWIGIPLKVEKEIIGVMGAQTYSPGIRYTKKDEQILTFVSSQIATVIDRKHHEQALLTSQKRNQLLIEASTDAIFLESMDGSILDCNDIALQLYGYTHDEIMKLNIRDLISPDYHHIIENYKLWTIDHGETFNDIVNIRKDGSSFPVDVSIRKTSVDDSAVFVAYVRDITVQKEIARVVIENEQKFRTLSETTTAGIFIYRGDKYLYVNPMWCQITGFPAEKLLKMKPLDIMDPNITLELISHIERADDGEIKQARVEHTIKTQGGEKCVIDLMVSRISFDGEPAIIGTAIDITNRKQREHELEIISEMSESLRININKDEVLNSMIDKLSAILQLDGAEIALVNKQKTKIDLIKTCGGWSDLQNSHLNKDQGLSGYIISSGRPYLNNEPKYETPFLYPELIKGYGAIAGVPLFVKGEIIGSVVVGSKGHFSENDLRLLQAIGDLTASALHRADLFEQTTQQTEELRHAYDSTLEGWALALELRDKETQGHSVRIAKRTLELAKRLNIPEDQMENIRRGALLHDIGKLGVPDTILLKNGTLTPSEWEIMKKHPVYAYNMLSQIKFFKDAIDIPYCHHEWFDGSGYPRGLEGEEIPLAVRIFSIVDVWDALTSTRPYRDAWTKEAVLEHIINQAGTHFDPDVVNEFIQMIVEEK